MKQEKDFIDIPVFIISYNRLAYLEKLVSGQWSGTAGNVLGRGTGSSIDFQDHRQYVPGDDPRHINWQAYARTGHYSMKLYREEVTPRIDLVYDVSGSMFLDTAKATIAIHAAAPVKTGAGPRHFALHPSGRFAYAVNELDLTVTAFTFDPQAGTLTEIQSLSTLPANTADRTGFSCAEIAVHPSGKFLYASNRGHDSIAVYGIDGDSGRLSFLAAVPAEVKTPRHFAVSPDGRFLLTEGQQSNSVAVFSIDQASGMLGFTGHSITVPSPVSAVFRTLD